MFVRRFIDFYLAVLDYFRTFAIVKTKPKY